MKGPVSKKSLSEQPLSKGSLAHRLLMPALLAITIAPLALSASAAPDTSKGDWPDQRQEYKEARRQALFERAGIDEATRQALEAARDEHQQALRELHEQHRERMDEILGEEQREALREARREMRDAWRAERRDAMQQRLTDLVDGWGLSEEERARLTEVRESLYADMQTLRERDFDSRDARREAWQAVRDEHHAAMSDLLSDEQITEMKEAMSPRGKHGPHQGGKHHHSGKHHRDGEAKGHND